MVKTILWENFSTEKYPDFVSDPDLNADENESYILLVHKVTREGLLIRKQRD